MKKKEVLRIIEQLEQLPCFTGDYCDEFCSIGQDDYAGHFEGVKQYFQDIDAYEVKGTTGMEDLTAEISIQLDSRNTQVKIHSLDDCIERLEEQLLKFERELLFFNGSQWYIKANEETVLIFDTGNLENLNYTIMDEEFSTRYIKNNLPLENPTDKLRAFIDCRPY